MVNCVHPAVVKAVEKYLEEQIGIKQVQVSDVIKPITHALEAVKTTKLEGAQRREFKKKNMLPELKVYPRVLCKRPTFTSSSTSRDALSKGKEDLAIIWETKLEEVLERELA